MKKKKICFITGTRAEYGIMKDLIKKVNDDPKICLQVIATNMHLSPEFGMTVSEIEEDGIKIDKKVEMMLSSDTHVGTVKSMGLGMIGFADALEELMPDLIVILGDRYEMLAAASAAQIFGIPIAHLHGGEITEGAYDDAIRHAITKLSFLHFTSTERYRERVIQMGEEPERVFWTGSISLNNINPKNSLTLKELEESLSTKLGDDFILVTYHPVTREPGMAKQHILDFLKAIEKETGSRKILFTLPNSDTDGRIIADIIKKWCKTNPDKGAAYESLGKKRYSSALSLCSAVVGNSSSGICEAPFFKIPTLNIGNRQKGREKGNNVVDCAADYKSVCEGLNKVLSKDFREFVKTNGTNPFFKKDGLDEIFKIITTTEVPKNAMKKFYDIQLN